jgi:hypothetical protein
LPPQNSATCHRGGNKDTGGNSNCRGTDNNQQSTKDSGSNGNRKGDNESNNDK